MVTKLSSALHCQRYCVVSQPNCSNRIAQAIQIGKQKMPARAIAFHTERDHCEINNDTARVSNTTSSYHKVGSPRTPMSNGSRNVIANVMLSPTIETEPMTPTSHLLPTTSKADALTDFNNSQVPPAIS